MHPFVSGVLLQIGRFSAASRHARMRQPCVRDHVAFGIRELAIVPDECRARARRHTQVQLREVCVAANVTFVEVKQATGKAAAAFQLVIFGYSVRVVIELLSVFVPRKQLNYKLVRKYNTGTVITLQTRYALKYRSTHEQKKVADSPNYL